MLQYVKRSSLALSKTVGATEWVARSRWRRERLLILCYHGVAMDDEHHWDPSLYVSIRTFERRLMLLRRHGCTVLPLGEAIERAARRDLPERAVVLTFDDGYYNFLACAYPRLRAYRLPATVYLTTLRCEHNLPVVNLLISYMLWLHRTSTLDGTGIAGLDAVPYPLATREQRKTVAARIAAEAKRRNFMHLDNDEIARAIAQRIGVDYDGFVANRLLTLLNPDEVAALASQGVDFQLHTHTHQTPPDPALFAEEVRENRVRIEAMTGTRPTHFCYPSGVYRRSYLPVLRAEQVVSATTCEPGLAGPDSDPLLLRRFVDANDVSDTEFEAWLSGAAAWLASLRTAYSGEAAS